MNEDSRALPPWQPTRRDLLRRGALISGAAVWTIPVIQVVSMTAAHADTPSAAAPPPTTAIDAATASAPVPVPAGGATNGSNGSKGQASATGALPGTGPTVPAVPAVVVGTAAVALGAGIVAAAHLRNRGDDPGEAETID